MKSTIIKPSIQLLFLLIAFTAGAVVIFPFESWSSLTQRSPDIIVARCTETPQRFKVEPDGAMGELTGRLIESDMQIVSVLKGRLTNGPIVLCSRFWPRQSEYYLVFGHFSDGIYNAYEDYRVVPLGIEFSTNELTGKSLDQQIKLMIERRFNILNHEMERGQEEKRRLEEGLKK